VRINGKRCWLWRAVDKDGCVLDEIVQNRRNTKAARRLLMRLLKRQGMAPKRMITDKLRSYGAARRQIIPGVEHRSHKGLNNRASLFGRLKSSAFRFSGFPIPGLQLSCGLLLLFGFGTTALPSWGRKNEAELSEKRPSAPIRTRGACPISNSLHSRPARGSLPPWCGSLWFSLYERSRSARYHQTT
jgi:IS1 family transposase